METKEVSWGYMKENQILFPFDNEANSLFTKVHNKSQEKGINISKAVEIYNQNCVFFSSANN